MSTSRSRRDGEDARWRGSRQLRSRWDLSGGGAGCSAEQRQGRRRGDRCLRRGAAEMAKMRDGVVLVNCARGGIYQEEALAAALNSGKVGAAAIDVYVEEPPRWRRCAMAWFSSIALAVGSIRRRRWLQR